jgi:glutamine synthetase
MKKIFIRHANATIMSKEEIAQVIKEKNIQWIQLHFTDVIGRLRVLHIPSNRFLNEIIDNGIGFDGSSVGLVKVEKSDLIAMPDIQTFNILPHEEDEARVIADIYDAKSQQFIADPRFILKKALEKATDQGYNDIKISPEMEFYVCNDIEEYNYEKIEAQGYLAPPPLDDVKEYRRTLSEYLQDSGYNVKYHHHEKGKYQHEVEIDGLDAISAADYCIYFKYLAREVASMYDLMVTFMPKPFPYNAGNGMHAHIAFNNNGDNVFQDENDEYNLSQTARYFIGGILEHAPGMTAIGNPTINSYKRLTPYFEAPIFITWARHNRSSLVRIPARKNIDVEIRNADPAANPYLLFAVMIHAGLDGIKRKIECDPIEKNIYKLSETDDKNEIKKLPTTLLEALDALEQDDVIKNALGAEILDLFVDKKKNEWKQYQGEITDLEYRLYFHC